VNELRLIRLAIALGKHGNFARAAESLNLTQPSLTRGIAELERTLGVPLFDRTRKGAIPTEFGRVLLERGGAVLASEASLRREIQLLAGLESGSLVVAAGPLASETSVAAAIARTLRAHPRLRVQCHTTDPELVVRDVLAERVDVGVAQVSEFEHDRRLVVERMSSLRVHVACRPGHPLTRVARLSFAQLLEYPLATNVLRGAPAAAVVRRDGTRVTGDAGAPEFIPQVVVNAPAVARLIARDSDALATGTASMLADDVAAGHLVILEVDAPVLRMTHGVMFLRGRTLAPAARAFIDALRAVEAEMRQADPPSARPRKSRSHRRRPA
jgi:DNA-binding transcriptional LysR family regulator